VHLGVEIATDLLEERITEANAPTLVPVVPYGNCVGIWA